MDRVRKWMWRGVGLALVVAIATVLIFRDEILDELFPFDLNAPPNILTGSHLRAMRERPRKCFNALARANVAFEAMPPRPIENGCGYANAAVLSRSTVSYGGGRVLLSCPALVALMLWERHVVAPAAAVYLNQKVTAIRHLGTYSCRNINHARSGRRSEHATANAIDIAGFALEDGSTVTIEKDWKGTTPRAEFLHAVRDGACRTFSVVLSPNYNAIHHDHLHLDEGAWQACR